MSLPPITQIPSPNKHVGRTRKVRVVVMHTMESPERATTAEDVARNWFSQAKARASAHYCIDNDSIVRCVEEADTAWAAPGANADGIQFEMSGYAEQGAAGWKDDYSRAMLDLTARLAADVCVRHGIPTDHISREQLRAGARGIVSHDDVSAVYKLSDHTDPGPDFPWELFIPLVKKYAATPQLAPSPKTRTTRFPLATGHWYGVNDKTPRSHSGVRAADRAQIKRIQAKVGSPADGVFGPATKAKVIVWQGKNKLTKDGAVGVVTWTKMGL